MSLNVMPQKTYFYKKSWNKKRDVMFLNLIHKCFSGLDVRDSHQVDSALAYAMLELNMNEGLKLDFEEVSCRYRCLLDRYEAFTLVLLDKYTHWDVAGGIIRAPDEVWSRLFKENSLLQAYYYADEPHYPLLELVFGNQSIQHEDEVSDEVDSPVVAPKRRLFVDEENSPTVYHRGPPPPKAVIPRKPSGSLDMSSCSSTSPLMCWKP